MLGVLSKIKRSIFRDVFLSGLILISCNVLVGVNALPESNIAYALIASTANQHYAPVTCPVPSDPTRSSLLVVLLDRSGSLIVEPGATDPNGYSTSVTKALADLWPGNMAVIPFRGDTTSLPILGPAALSDQAQQADLKNKIQNTPIGGGTPLAPAMQEALALLQQQGNPAGSRVVVITDGNPTGTPPGGIPTATQEQDIRANLIPQFCSRGIPVSAFGLKINPQSRAGQDANQLLTDITSGTEAAYQDVESPEDLARAVIGLYADWQHLNFTKEEPQGSSFPVPIDTFAQQVKIVSFRSDSMYPVTLLDPNAQPVTLSGQSTDRHYEIDTLDVSGPNIPGNYSVTIQGDTDAQVYALVKSPLQVRLVAPTPKTIAYDNKAVHIQAEFLNGSDLLTPQQGQGQLIASVTLLVNGQPAGPPTNDIILKQQGDTPIFSGDSLVYNQPGQLLIKLEGAYQQVKRQANFTLQLLKPPPPPPPVYVCKKGLLSCFWDQYHTLVLILGPLLLVLSVLLIWLLARHSRPKAFGWIANGRSSVQLASFQKPIIGSQEILRRGQFRFSAATRFEVVFKKGGRAYIRAAKGNGSNIQVTTGGTTKRIMRPGEQAELKLGSSFTDGRESVSFSNSNNANNAVTFLNASRGHQW